MVSCAIWHICHDKSVERSCCNALKKNGWHRQKHLHVLQSSAAMYQVERLHTLKCVPVIWLFGHEQSTFDTWCLQHPTRSSGCFLLTLISTVRALQNIKVTRIRICDVTGSFVSVTTINHYHLHHPKYLNKNPPSRSRWSRWLRAASLRGRRSWWVRTASWGQRRLRPLRSWEQKGHASPPGWKEFARPPARRWGNLLISLSPTSKWQKNPNPTTRLGNDERI